jgi:ribose transport system ATP-binding protein
MTDPAATLALSVRSVSKTYPGVRALDSVDLDIKFGEVHALCGGNGSGKSTLVKILTGVVPGDEGSIRIGDQTIDASQIRHSVVHELGVRVVHQDLAMFPDLSVAENMALGAQYPTVGAKIRHGELRRRALAQMERFDIHTKPETLVRDLPVATRTQVAIARALQDVVDDRAVIILDEPTAALAAHEVNIFLRAIRGLASRGHAILFISHRLDEVLATTDQVTVLRDGKVFAEHETSKLTEKELIESIIGRQVATVQRESSVAADAASVLSVTSLSAGPLHRVNLELRAGEVVGVAGLLGSGRTELLQALWGDLERSEGIVILNGREVNFSRNEQAIGAGVVMVPEDRVTGGAFTDLTLDENMNVSVLGKYWRWRGFHRNKMRADSADLRERFRIKAPSGSVAMRTLSGGNQQKAILARWVRRDPILLLLDEPTQGVDVAARADIYEAIREVTRAGSAALVVTSDLEELAAMVDRAVVLRNGRVIAEVSHGDLSAQHLNELIYQETEERDD